MKTNIYTTKIQMNGSHFISGYAIMMTMIMNQENPLDGWILGGGLERLYLYGEE
jgi:hypothetical protein